MMMALAPPVWRRLLVALLVLGLAGSACKGSGDASDTLDTTVDVDDAASDAAGDAPGAGDTDTTDNDAEDAFEPPVPEYARSDAPYTMDTETGRRRSAMW